MRWINFRLLTHVEPKPVLHCIVGKHIGHGEYIVKIGEPLTLDQAEYFAHSGWEVILDPDDLAALARWEQLNRRPKWNRW